MLCCIVQHVARTLHDRTANSLRDLDATGGPMAACMKENGRYRRRGNCNPCAHGGPCDTLTAINSYRDVHTHMFQHDMTPQGGVKHGSGTYTWPNGAVYRGDWLNGCMHGVGTFTTVDGSCYTGSWAEDLKQGLGRKEYPNGDVYEVR